MIYFVLIFQITNALKETLSAEYDRKAASPTESAARWKQRWEHSGADHLKPSRVIRTTYVTCREWTERSNILLEMSVCQCGWYRGYDLRLSVPGYSDYVSRDFFYANVAGHVTGIEPERSA